MLKNYFKIAVRNLRKHKGYSFINIAGLAIGMTCCVLILLYVRHELSYDRYHQHAENIYRVERKITFHEEHGQYPVTAHPYGPALKSEFPEVEDAVRILPGDTDFLDRNRQYSRARIIYADSTVFNVFTWPLMDGDPRTALREPFTVVITASLAQRHFPSEDALGKTLYMQGGRDYDLKVTGVMPDVPENSHFHCDAIVSYATLQTFFGAAAMNEWFNHDNYTYVLLRENGDPAALQAKLPGWMEKYMGNRARELMGPDVDITQYVQLKLKPLTDIHLHSHLEHEIEPNGDIATVYIFSAVALLILLIACINFMNLATARSMERAKEVGLRKVVGAERSHLIFRFLGESVLMSFLALLLSIGLIELLLPMFSSLTGKELDISYFDNPLWALGFIGVALLVGAFAGSYPAFILSAFQPVTVLKGEFRANTKGALLRKVLVVAQFSISIALIIGTVVVMKQLDYLRNKKLGFNKQHAVIIPMKDANLTPTRLAALQHEIAQAPSIVSVATGNHVPGDRLYSETMFRKDRTSSHVESMENMQYYYVSHDYLTTLGVEMAAGRNFDRAFATDSAAGFVINEAAVKKMGWSSPEEAVRKPFDRAEGVSPLTFKQGQVIGVVKDFHYESLHDAIEPIVLELNPNAYGYVIVRIQPQNIPQTLTFLEEKMQQFSPAYAFDYFFQDEYFDSLYRSEERLQKIFGYFTFLAIFIACLGLFGLASYMAEQRTKEVGIRKVLGATLLTIVQLFSKDFVKLVLLANVVAWPVAWFAMNRWLQDFAYRIDMSWWMFALAGGMALTIALLTVSWQAIRAAMANPIESLRYE